MNLTTSILEPELELLRNCFVLQDQRLGCEGCEPSILEMHCVLVGFQSRDLHVRQLIARRVGKHCLLNVDVFLFGIYFF